MYKLFLCLRYLRSRVLAYFAVLAVALCVAMMLIVVSVMNGFLEKIEVAAKGLFGDIVIEAAGEYGLARYDELIDRLERDVPEVEAASPFILSYGVLRVPGQPHYRMPVQIAGIRLPERAEVSDFEDGLFVQEGVEEPTFDPPIERMLQKVIADRKRVERLGEQADQSTGGYTAERLAGAALNYLDAERILRNAAVYQEQVKELSARLDEARAAGDARTVTQLEQQLADTVRRSGLQLPGDRVIPGLGISGLSFRTDEGETVRVLLPGHDVVVYVFPLGGSLSVTEMSPNVRRVTIVDDNSSGVWSIDSKIVYMPFSTLQLLNNMAPAYDPEDPERVVQPGRCSQIHVKVRGEGMDERRLRRIRDKVEVVWSRFAQDHPDAARTGVSVSTWRQRQADVVGPIETQRTLVVTMFGIISLVAVVLIFVIFYMIVVQKTRDIGVLKAVGASSGGVAGIFLAYGAAVGLVGAILGTVGGYYFVRYINPIQDAMDRWFGFRVWDRKIFMFEEIPNEVEPLTALAIVVGAIVAGLIGALIPAIRAARMQPVEALRYE